MRSTIAIIMGFVILLGSSLYVANRINYTSENMQVQLDQAEISIRANNWEQALGQINETYQHWSKSKNWWAVVLNHSTLSNIEISYLRLQEFTANKEVSLSLAELKTLLFLLKEIPESETLRFNNIL